MLGAYLLSIGYGLSVFLMGLLAHAVVQRDYVTQRVPVETATG
ncbi:MAG TPA: hypothetical protein VIZ86_15885 [Pseudomonas sp.]